jgi:hypothetical protein
VTDVSLNAKERRANEAILKAMEAVRDLSDSGPSPYNYVEEVVPAIHTMQMFVLMHWAHRINPQEWSNWFNVPATGFSDILANLT